MSFGGPQTSRGATHSWCAWRAVSDHLSEEQWAAVRVRGLALLRPEQLHRDSGVAAEAEDFVARIIDEGRLFDLEVHAGWALRRKEWPAAARHEEPLRRSPARHAELFVIYASKTLGHPISRGHQRNAAVGASLIAQSKHTPATRSTVRRLRASRVQPSAPRFPDKLREVDR
jgi:hypothetical protein